MNPYKEVFDNAIEAARVTKEHTAPIFKLMRATKNASTECCDEIEEGERKEELECENANIE